MQVNRQLQIIHTLSLEDPHAIAPVVSIPRRIIQECQAQNLDGRDERVLKEVSV